MAQKEQIRKFVSGLSVSPNEVNAKMHGQDSRSLSYFI